MRLAPVSNSVKGRNSSWVSASRHPQAHRDHHALEPAPAPGGLVGGSTTRLLAALRRRRPRRRPRSSRGAGRETGTRDRETRTRAAAAAPTVDGEWPRRFTTPSGAAVTLYQPQVASWQDQKHLVLFRASYTAKAGEKPALGTIKAEAETKVSVAERLGITRP